MSVSLYGTSDGRRTEIQNFRQWDERPPLPTVYIEDPELALGQRRQVDWAVTGLRTTFDNVVFDRDGNEIRRTSFPSNYRPWAAVFMVGTRH
jgi:vancomycin resistance protein YoaR